MTHGPPGRALLGQHGHVQGDDEKGGNTVEHNVAASGSYAAFSSWRTLGRSNAPAMMNELRHFAGPVGVELHGGGDVRHWPDSDYGNLPRAAVHVVDKGLCRGRGVSRLVCRWGTSCQISCEATLSRRWCRSVRQPVESWTKVPGAPRCTGTSPAASRTWNTQCTPCSTGTFPATTVIASSSISGERSARPKARASSMSVIRASPSARSGGRPQQRRDRGEARPACTLCASSEEVRPS